LDKKTEGKKEVRTKGGGGEGAPLGASLCLFSRRANGESVKRWFTGRKGESAGKKKGEIDPRLL